MHVFWVILSSHVSRVAPNVHQHLIKNKNYLNYRSLLHIRLAPLPRALYAGGNGSCSNPVCCCHLWENVSFRAAM